MLPVGFLMALTLWTGNGGYLYLTVAFIQVWSPARSHGHEDGCWLACNSVNAVFCQLNTTVLVAPFLFRRCSRPSHLLSRLAALLVVQLEDRTSNLMLSMLLIASGTVLGVYTEVRMSFKGLTLRVLNS